LTAVMGILAALLEARETGEGRYLDVSVTHSLLAHSVVALSALGGAQPQAALASGTFVKISCELANELLVITTAPPCSFPR